MKGKRGGARVGAGRPAACDNVVHVSYRISASAKNRIKAFQTTMGISVASLIDKMLDCYEKK
ncbi:MAG: hypothetical protein ACI4TU_10000 [Candidatus Cryptobacteroides sp.]